MVASFFASERGDAGRGKVVVDPTKAVRSGHWRAVIGDARPEHRGRPRYALLKIDDYYRFTAPEPRSLLALMDALLSGNFDFEPATIDGALKQADLQ